MPKKGEIWYYWTKPQALKGKKVYKYGKIVKLGDGVDLDKNMVSVERVEKVGGKWRTKSYVGKGPAVAVKLSAFQQDGAKRVKESTPEEQFEPSKYKKGQKYNYQAPKKEATIIEVVGEEDGGLRVKRAGKNEKGWIVRRVGLIKDRVKKEDTKPSSEEVPAEN